MDGAILAETEIVLWLGQVKQLKEWLLNWDATFLRPVAKGTKGKKRGGGASSSGNEKKAVLLSGTPGIGKTTTARLLCKELGFETLEVGGRLFALWFCEQAFQ